MKKLRKDITLFLLSVIFIIAGMTSIPFLKFIYSNALGVLKGNNTVTDTIKNIDGNVDKYLTYHNILMDIESLRLRITGTRYIVKEGTTIAVADNGQLSGPTGYLDPDNMREISHKVKKLQDFSNDNGADFLYVYAPNKNMYVNLPVGLNNYEAENYENYLNALKAEEVNVLDLYAEAGTDELKSDEMYFVTDHHWKPETGFWAFGKICQKLDSSYGFEYDPELTDINNYDVKTYENWFLGSWGKKTGRFFTPLGLDDISLITPSFKTDLIESQPLKGEIKEGTFENTVMNLSFLKNKDLYGLNPYAAYSGGDFRLQIVKNNKASNNSVILVIRDSYACAVTPFLSLACKETHVIDIRDFENYKGDQIDLKEYISEIKPDYVIVLYNSVSGYDNSSKQYDFIKY